jgi:hypothetical protein
MPSDGKSSLCLWQGELKRTIKSLMKFLVSENKAFTQFSIEYYI